MDRATPRFNRTSLFLASTAHFINTRRTVLATYRGRTSHFTLAAKRTNKSRYHHPAPSYHRCCLNLSLSFSLSFSLPMCIYTSELILARIFSNAFMRYLKGNTGLEFLTSRKVRQGIGRNNSNRFRYQWDFIKKFLRRKQQSIKFYLNRKPRLQLSVSLLIQILQYQTREIEKLGRAIEEFSVL